MKRRDLNDLTPARIDALMDAAPSSPGADELDVLVTLAEAYEAEHHPIPPPDPGDAVYFQQASAAGRLG